MSNGNVHSPPHRKDSKVRGMRTLFMLRCFLTCTVMERLEQGPSSRTIARGRLDMRLVIFFVSLYNQRKICSFKILFFLKKKNKQQQNSNIFKRIATTFKRQLNNCMFLSLIGSLGFVCKVWIRCL